MTKNVAKNRYGYNHSQIRLEILKTILMFTAAGGVLLIGIFATGSRNNLLTIVAVLGLLPAAKSLISCIMFARGKKAVCPENLHQKILQITEASENAPLLRYDLYMTSSDKCYPIYVMAGKDKCLIGYSGEKNFHPEKAEEHIRAMIKQNAYDVSVVKIFTDEQKFLERLTSLTEKEGSCSDMDSLLIRLMENLTL